MLSGILLGVVLAAAVLIPLAWWRGERQAARTRAAERRAHAAERMAEIGAMTGGLAHEIKNPLSTIGLNAQLLAESLREWRPADADQAQERDRLLRRIDTLRREADRLRDILADFLRFAGEVKLERRPVDLNTVVEELVDFYLPQAEHHGVTLRTQLHAAPMPVLLDVSLFKQALLNLLLNATQAMEGDERSDAQGRAARELILRTAPGSCHGEPGFEVHVIDTGPGIPQDRLAQIFTPYFTTRAGGSGLGLPTAKRIVEGHDGEIGVVTELGRGTDFVIRVPRAE
jgi:signal transduction histidine kinase